VNFNVLLSCVALDNKTGLRDGNETTIGHACGKLAPKIYENIYADNMKSFWIRRLQVYQVDWKPKKTKALNMGMYSLLLSVGNAYLPKRSCCFVMLQLLQKV
jgi:hypothetical protein